MSGLPSIRYPAPVESPPATAWGSEWRRRWFRTVGSVHEHYQTGELVAYYSNQRDPVARLALQAELEARPNGVSDVLAACRAQVDAFNAAMKAAR